MITSTDSPTENSTTAFLRPFNEDAVTVSAVLILAMMIFGILANLVTIIVIAKSRHLRTIFNLLIVSLCVSDLLSALVSPLFLYRRTWGFDEWLIPGFLCKIFWAVDTWTSYATALHILLFAIIRLISVKWTLKYKNIKMAHVKIIAALIWLLTFCCGFIPRWVWYGAETRDRQASTEDSKWPACSLNMDWLQQYKLYYEIAFPIFIYFPMIMIAVMSPTIAIILLRKRNKRFVRKETLTPTKRQHHSRCEIRTRKRENHAIMQLAFITGSFMFGYIPITSYTFYTTNVRQSTVPGNVYDWNFGMLAYILLRLSECLNPIFYNVASGKMRSETFTFLKCLSQCCLRPIKGIRGRLSSSSSSGGSETPPAKNSMNLDL